MARFLAAIEGQSGYEETRLGSPNSGIRAQAQGWRSGVKVYGHADGESDVFDVYVTGGSSGSTRSERIARIVDGVIEFDPDDVFAAEAFEHAAS